MLNRFPIVYSFDTVKLEYGGFIGAHFSTQSAVNYKVAQANTITTDFGSITITSNSRSVSEPSAVNILPINDAYFNILDTNTFLSDLTLNLGNNKVIFYLNGVT